ncbi:MAG: lysoplasmalogenase [Oscillospiraceae bacterium]|nr:lysoplasmalogenase [Oscillospiraceae bacterium]
MTVLYALGIACVCASVATAYCRNKKLEKAQLSLKLTASMLFCVTGVHAAALRESMNARAALLLIALLLGLLGDVLLGLDYFLKKEHIAFIFLLGGGSFFFGHLLYVLLLLPLGGFHPWLLALLPFVPLLFLALQRCRILDLGKNLIPLMAYGLMLGAMLLSTLNLALQGGTLGRWMIFPGIFFVISDLSLFLSKFGNQRITPLQNALSYMIMLPYFSAQAIFAVTVGLV